jgi:hypothetical protein
MNVERDHLKCDFKCIESTHYRLTAKPLFKQAMISLQGMAGFGCPK